ncbi:hypothetical protein yc1106_05341 [Curvularia clavata]|uniref:Altered inheritance of mitochondria protein 9, mitochondrial n=1 Tax=Curvularia clavata TaxID=95742 RepID=A0A9Q9DST7_CURCL|nr:hypothetical protein yc1106_05341 [Curvularia clavata]
MTSRPKRSMLEVRNDLLYRLRWNVFGPLDEIEIRTGPWDQTTDVPLFGHPLAKESIAVPPVSRIDKLCIAECLDRVDYRMEEAYQYKPPPPLTIHNEDGSAISIGQFVTEAHAYLNLHAEALKDAKGRLYGIPGETDPITGICTIVDHYLPPSTRLFFKRVDAVQIGEINQFSVSVFAEGEMFITAEDFWDRQLVGVRFCPDPYRYTSGRWLRDDALEQESRLIHFDFDALCRRVLALCPGASSITSYEKKEGGFNRVFIFHTDNAKRIVAGLSFAFAGLARMTTSSEVATIQYSETNVPIPKILDWSDDASNAIGSEYIIMEHASGIPLHERWPTMDVSDQIRCIETICQKLKEIVDLNFPAYGSLYFAETPHIPTTSKLLLNRKYYHDIKPSQGPWLNINDYSDGLIDTGISRIPPAESISKRPRYQGSIDTHKKLLNYGRAMIKEMAKSPQIQNIASPMMFHPDLHKRNIFVSDEDPTVVSAIIDWQSTSIEPAFWYADSTPDFAQPILDPSGEDRIEPKSEACAKAYDYCVQFLAPKLFAARSTDEDYLRPFRYCYRTWEDGAVAFRE